MRQRDKKRISRSFIASSVAAFLCVIFGASHHELVAGNKDAINIIVTVFSILAGFLAAMIGLVSDAFLAHAKNWHELRTIKKAIINRLIRQQVLFFIYLLTLGTAAALFLLPPEFVETRKWVEGAFLSLATFSFIMSFTLPTTLFRLQVERYELKMRSMEPSAISQVRRDQTKSKESLARKA